MSTDLLAPGDAFPLPFREAVRDFLWGRGRSLETLRAYRDDLRRWFEFCHAHGLDVTRPTPTGAGAYREQLRRQGAAAPKTVERRLTVLSSFYSFARDSGRLPGVANPFQRRITLRDPDDPRHPHEAVSREVVMKMLKACGEDRIAGPRDAALIAFLYGTGVRRAGVVTLKWGDVALGATPPVARVEVKGGKIQDLFLPAAVVKALKALRFEDARRLTGPNALVFRTIDGQRGLRLDEVNEIITARGAQIGVHVTPHQFRAAFGTRGYDQIEKGELSERGLADAMGHKKVETTRKYDRKARGAGVADALWDLPLDTDDPAGAK